MAKKKIPRFAIFFVEQTPPPKKKESPPSVHWWLKMQHKSVVERMHVLIYLFFLFLLYVQCLLHIQYLL